MTDRYALDFDLTHSVKSEDILKGTGRLERLSWLHEKIGKGGIFFFQDGMRSKIVFQEAADTFINGQYIASIALGFSFIERTVAGRLWHLNEKKKAKTRNNSQLLNFTKERDWLTDGEVTALNNLRDVRNYVVHFKDPDSAEMKVHNIFEKQPRSVDFEADAYAVMQAAIDVLSKTAL